MDHLQLLETLQRHIADDAATHEALVEGLTRHVDESPGEDPAEHAVLAALLDEHIAVVTGSHERLLAAFERHITQVRPAPDTILSGIVAPDKGESLTFDLATSTWRNGINGDPPGTIVQSLLTEAQFIASVPAHQQGDWVLADGRNVAGSRYAQITGETTVPDLRGAFIRAAGQNANLDWNGGAVGWHEDTTRGPRNKPLTGMARATDVHMRWRGSYASDGAYERADKGYISDNFSSGVGWIRTISSHSHPVEVTGGGDTETAPKHYSMNHFVKIN